MAETAAHTTVTGIETPTTGSLGVSLARIFAWASVAATFAFLLNNYLTHWLGFPGIDGALNGTSSALGLVQIGVVVAAFVIAIGFVQTSQRTLRQDSDALHNLAAFIIRAAFWGVFLVGIADTAISFARVEGMLPGLVGDQMATDLGRSQWRGPYVHMPLIGLGILIGLFTRSLGFPWLALLVVVAELIIVISRFIFSYEQAFMGDLVRFWYAALFLFASAYTLFDDGHVRVDVFYAGFTSRTKGWVNAVGATILGMALCWTILLLGLWTKSSIINSAMLSYEVTQSGFGMYVKYLMAGFLGVFATSMMIEFASAFLTGVADRRGDPGAREKVEESLGH